MKKQKTLKELTLKDDFMFGAVMSDENNCRKLLEMILQFPIEKVEVRRQKHIDYHPEYKGIRLDVYAKDAAHTHYNVEMQDIRNCPIHMLSLSAILIRLVKESTVILLKTVVWRFPI